MIAFITFNIVMRKKYQTVNAVSKSGIQMVERGKFDTPNTQIHDRSLSCLSANLLS